MFVKGMLHSCKVLTLYLDYQGPFSVSPLIYVSNGGDLLQMDLLGSVMAETCCRWTSSMAAQVK